MSMDRTIEKKGIPLKKVFTLAVVVLAALAIIWSVLSAGSKRTYRADPERIVVSTVSNSIFRDSIPVRATIEPLKTVYIDAVQGGTVAEVLVEEGTEVKAGQPLLRFTNTAFQLNVFSQEARISEQLDINSNTRLSLDQNRLNLKRQLNDTEYAITRLKRSIRRIETLRDKDLVSQDDMDKLKDELEYHIKQRDITLESIEREEAIRTTKIAQLKESEDRLTEHLKVVRQSLEDLEVKAPISGMLTSLDVEIGESKPGGARLGKIDKIDNYKLNAEIDEFYISRVSEGQIAEFKISGKTYQASVSKIYPEVNSGRFEVDLEFTSEPPSEVRRGLSVQMQLQLGADQESLILANGGFYQDTGGSWVFVVKDNGVATRRDVSFGRRNRDSIEVRSGLQPGDRVITSSYTNWMEIDEIIINN